MSVLIQRQVCPSSLPGADHASSLACYRLDSSKPHYSIPYVMFLPSPMRLRQQAMEFAFRRESCWMRKKCDCLSACFELGLDCRAQLSQATNEKESTTESIKSTPVIIAVPLMMPELGKRQEGAVGCVGVERMGRSSGLLLRKQNPRQGNPL